MSLGWKTLSHRLHADIIRNRGAPLNLDVDVQGGRQGNQGSCGQDQRQGGGRGPGIEHYHFGW